MDGSELIRFPTRTPDSFEDLLVERGDAPFSQIRGNLTCAALDRGPTPLVIISIGSRGLSSGRESLYGSAFLQAGFSTLFIDGYTDRGFSETMSDQGRLSYAASVADAFFALDHLAVDRRIDPNRIALLGYSRGGLVSVLAYDRKLQSAVVSGRHRYCAHVALYPPCYIQWRTPTPPSSRMLMLFGGEDVQARASVGLSYADRLRQAGGTVETIVYPEAVHSFDAAHPAALTGGVNLSSAEIRIDDFGRMTELTTGLAAERGWPKFQSALRDRLGRNGSVTGHGPLPRDIAVRPIVNFLTRAFSTSDQT